MNCELCRKSWEKPQNLQAPSLVHKKTTLAFGWQKFAKEVWCLSACVKCGDTHPAWDTFRQCVSISSGLRVQKAPIWGICVWHILLTFISLKSFQCALFINMCACLFASICFKNECISYFSLPPKSSSKSPTWFIQDSSCFGSHFNGCISFAFSICMKVHGCQIASKILTIISSWRSASKKIGQTTALSIHCCGRINLFLCF